MKESNVIQDQDGTFTINVKGKAEITYSEPIPFLGIYEEENEKLAVAKNSTFKYAKGADVQAVWRANGWKAPTTYRNDFLFAENRKAAGLSR